MSQTVCNHSVNDIKFMHEANHEDKTKIEYQKDGHFTRPASTFRNFVSADPNSQFPAEKGRYALYISPGCPWVCISCYIR